MTALLAVTVIMAGGLAAVIRYLVTALFASQARLPWAVLIVNTVGSLLAGSTLALAATNDEWTMLLLAGVAGGLTTFSTLSVETVELVLAGRARTAVISVVSNLVAGLTALAVGYVVPFVVVFFLTVIAL